MIVGLRCRARAIGAWHKVCSMASRSQSGRRIVQRTNRYWLLVVVVAIGMSSHVALALDQVTFGTNWKAQAEHGGYYQAVAAGIYERHGLDVTIRPGGPQVNHAQLLAAGKIDFNMGANAFNAFNFVQNEIPMTTVA